MGTFLDNGKEHGNYHLRSTGDYIWSIMGKSETRPLASKRVRPQSDKDSSATYVVGESKVGFTGTIM